MCGLVALVTGMGKANCTQVHLVKWQTVILIIMIVMFYIYLSTMLSSSQVAWSKAWDCILTVATAEQTPEISIYKILIWPTVVQLIMEISKICTLLYFIIVPFVCVCVCVCVFVCVCVWRGGTFGPRKGSKSVKMCQSHLCFLCVYMFRCWDIWYSHWSTILW